MNSEYNIKGSSGPDEISLHELIIKLRDCYRYLLSKWLIIVLFGILGGIVGFVYALYKKPIYTATTTFVLEDDKAGGGGLGSLAGLASIAGVDLGSGGGGIFQGDNILELYKSRSMIEKTLLTEVDLNGTKLLLIDRYIGFNNLRKVWADKPELKDIHFSVLESTTQKSTRLKDSILRSVVKDINLNYLNVFKPDKKLSIIQADVKATDEFFAKSFNEKIVKNVNDFYVQTKTLKSISNVRILQHKADSVRRVMNGAIYSAVAIADATPNLNVTRQVQRIAPVQRSQFSAETNKAILSELVKNLEMSKMALVKETPLVQIVDQPIFPLEKYNISKVISTLIGLLICLFLIISFLILRKIIKVYANI